MIIINQFHFFWGKKKEKVKKFSPKNTLIADGHTNYLKWDRTAFGEIILNK